MLAIAIANGALRDLGYKRWTGDLLAHQISTGILILLFAIYIWFCMKWFPPANGIQAVWIGLLWVLMTLVFEFGFGRWRGESWEKLLADYNLVKGHLWVLIPIWIGLAPYLFFRLR